jgi:ribulose-phosphate 3-epimerase
MPESSRVFDRIRSFTPTLSVGILTADLMSLGAQVRLMEDAGVQLLHFDVMDGCFCPMLTFGPPLIKAVRTSLIKDIHLMVEDPLPKLESYVAAGADIITVHVEACSHPHRVLQVLGEMVNANDPARGIVRGVALNPGTALEAVYPLLDEVDLVLLLAVNPGWSGQRFIASTARRAADLLARKGERDFLLALDGGITKNNVGDAVLMGADLIVTGSAVFDGKAPAENARQMLAAVAEARRAPV